MARNSSGTDSAVNGPYVAGTVISSAAINARFSDAETELTDSLSRSGKGGMTAALRGTDGTKAAPAISATSETSSGIYRAGASDWRFSVAATDVLKWLATSLVSLLPHTFTGSATRAPVNLTPLAAPSAPSDGDLWIETTSNKLKSRINGTTGTYPTSPVARSDLPTVGQQKSTSSGSFAGTSATTYADVTNLTVTLTSTGRPVLLAMQPDGTNPASIDTASTSQDLTIAFLRDAAVIAEWKMRDMQALAAMPNPGFMMLDTGPSAAAHTWKVQFKMTAAAIGVDINNYVLVAYEL